MVHWHTAATLKQPDKLASENHSTNTHDHAPLRLPYNAVDKLGCDVDAVFSEHKI